MGIIIPLRRKRLTATGTKTTYYIGERERVTVEFNAFRNEYQGQLDGPDGRTLFTDWLPGQSEVVADLIDRSLFASP
jgi:hypothetical protein